MSFDDRNYDLPQTKLFERLERLYENNGFYEREFQNNFKLKHLYDKGIKPLRSCVHRSVEFYTAKLNVPLTVQSDNQQVTDCINQFLQESNFAGIKPVTLRQLSLFGNLFLKVLTDGQKVWSEPIKPKYISLLELDTRGYITKIRIDIPVIDENNQNKTYTEYWSKPEGYYAVWNAHTRGINAKLEELGDASDTGWLTDLGIDFVPIVMIQFKNIGEKWGYGSTFHALDKIFEANKEASRISDLAFRYLKHLTVLSTDAKDANGKPKYAPLIENDKDIFDDDSDAVLRLPGGATVNSLVPNVGYESFLKILESTMNEIESDLPELRYYSIKDGSMSGKAIRSILGGAIDRASEALINYKQGIVRLNKMALTIGKFWGIYQLSGSFDEGSWDHTIQTPELFPLGEDEKSSALKNYSDSGLALPTALRLAGFDEATIQKAVEEKQIQDSQILANQQNSLGAALTQFNSGV